MPKISTANLYDKDIRGLSPANKIYKRAVGNPKELYIKVYPSGLKIFVIQYKSINHFKLKEFREGIYSVAEARKDAIELIRKFENGFVRSKDKYQLTALFEKYIDKKEKIDQLDKTYLDKVKSRIKKYILPKFGNVDIKDIKFNDLKNILMPLFNPHNQKKSRLETIHRIINTLNSLYENAIKDRYIDYNPWNGSANKKSLNASNFMRKSTSKYCKYPVETFGFKEWNLEHTSTTNENATRSSDCP